MSAIVILVRNKRIWNVNININSGHSRFHLNTVIKLLKFITKVFIISLVVSKPRHRAEKVRRRLLDSFAVKSRRLAAGAAVGIKGDGGSG